jgi:hypothetical protein
MRLVRTKTIFCVHVTHDMEQWRTSSLDITSPNLQRYDLKIFDSSLPTIIEYYCRLFISALTLFASLQ